MEFLREILGEELFTQVTEKLQGAERIEIANVADGSYIPKQKFNSVNEQVKALKNQVGDREQQLLELKSLEPEKLQQRISELEQSNAIQRKDYEKQLSQQAFDYALNGALGKSGTKNSVALKALLDMGAISLDGENLVGLQEQIDALMESDGYLFDMPKGATGATNPTGVKKKAVDKDRLSDAQFFAQIFK